MRRTELRKMSKPRAAAASATPALCGATAPDAAILVGGLERHFLIEEKLWRSFRQNVLQQYSPSAEVILYLKVLNLSSSGHVGRHSQKHRPRRTLAGEQFEAWLQGAREGYCELTDEESGNCETDDRGSIRLSAEAATFRQSAQECAERCLGCAQCRFISFSARHRDCSWFHACDVRDLHTPAGASHHTLQVDASSGAQRGSEQDQLVQRLREQALRQLAPAAVRIDLDSDTVPRLSREVAQTCRQQRSLRLSDSALGYFHTLKALWQLMAGREAERGRTFEQLMFVRPDLVHWLPMGPHCLFRRSVVHHSMGATCAKEVGRVPPHSVDGVSSNRVGMCALYAGFARLRTDRARAWQSAIEAQIRCNRLDFWFLAPRPYFVVLAGILDAALACKYRAPAQTSQTPCAAGSKHEDLRAWKEHNAEALPLCPAALPLRAQTGNTHRAPSGGAAHPSPLAEWRA